MQKRIEKLMKVSTNINNYTFENKEKLGESL